MAEELGKIEKPSAVENRHNKMRSDTCYDVATGRYLTFREWIECFLSTSKL